jgi:hypothetical protein
VAVLLVKITPTREDVDEWLWVVVGDLPPAYLVADDAPGPAAALRAYISSVTRGDRGLRRVGQVQRGTTLPAHQSQGAPFAADRPPQRMSTSCSACSINLRGQDLLRRPASSAHFAAVPAELQRT